MKVIVGFILTGSTFKVNIKSFPNKNVWIRREEEIVVISCPESIKYIDSNTFDICLTYSNFMNINDGQCLKYNPKRLFALTGNSIWGERTQGKVHGLSIADFKITYLDMDGDELAPCDVIKKCCCVHLEVTVNADDLKSYGVLTNFDIEDIDIVNVVISSTSNFHGGINFKVTARCGEGEVLLSGLKHKDFKIYGKYKGLLILENADHTYTATFDVPPDVFSIKHPNLTGLEVRSKTICNI